MRRLLTAVALATALVVALAGPGSATHGGKHPTFGEKRYYFHCAGGSTMKLQNLSSPSPFDAMAPMTSVAGGGGCGVVDPGVLINTSPSGGPADAAFSGTFTGNVKNMTVELWLAGHTNYSPLLPADVDIWLVIDGNEYLAQATHVAEIPYQGSLTAAFRKIEFSVVDLGWTKNVFNAQGELVDVLYGGVVADDGNGTTEHEVQVTIRQHYSDEAGTWVWDASDIASGITINDPTPSAKQVSAGQIAP